MTRLVGKVQSKTAQNHQCIMVCFEFVSLLNRILIICIKVSLWNNFGNLVL